MDFLTIKKAPEEVSKVIRNSCYDCHSNETKYPWYSNIAPVSWWMKDHIIDGRKHLNFSTFATYDTERQLRKLDESVEMIEKIKCLWKPTFWLIRMPDLVTWIKNTD